LTSEIVLNPDEIAGLARNDGDIEPEMMEIVSTQ